MSVYFTEQQHQTFMAQGYTYRAQLDEPTVIHDGRTYCPIIYTRHLGYCERLSQCCLATLASLCCLCYPAEGAIRCYFALDAVEEQEGYIPSSILDAEAAQKSGSYVLCKGIV